MVPVNGNGSPLKLLLSLGVGGAGLILLIWYVVIPIVNRMPLIEEKVNAIDIRTTAIKEQHQNMDNRGEMMIKLLRGQCLNAAETAEEKLRCNP